MALKSFGHAIEKRVMRPFFRRVKKLLRVSSSSARIVTLEERIERLESLFREQAGLHYLRLAEPPVTDAATTVKRDIA
jgi:hypothetical protein